MNKVAIFRNCSIPCATSQLSLGDWLGPKKGTCVVVRVAKLLRLSIYGFTLNISFALIHRSKTPSI